MMQKFEQEMWCLLVVWFETEFWVDLLSLNNKKSCGLLQEQ